MGAPGVPGPALASASDPLDDLSHGLSVPVPAAWVSPCLPAPPAARCPLLTRPTRPTTLFSLPVSSSLHPLYGSPPPVSLWLALCVCLSHCLSVGLAAASSARPVRSGHAPPLCVSARARRPCPRASAAASSAWRRERRPLSFLLNSVTQSSTAGYQRSAQRRGATVPLSLYVSLCVSWCCEDPISRSPRFLVTRSSIHRKCWCRRGPLESFPRFLNHNLGTAPTPGCWPGWPDGCRGDLSSMASHALRRHVRAVCHRTRLVCRLAAARCCCASSALPRDDSLAPEPTSPGPEHEAAGLPVGENQWDSNR